MNNGYLARDGGQVGRGSSEAMGFRIETTAPPANGFVKYTIAFEKGGVSYWSYSLKPKGIFNSAFYIGLKGAAGGTLARTAVPPADRVAGAVQPQTVAPPTGKAQTTDVTVGA